MRALGASLAALTLAACATTQEPSACPAGQENLRTAQLYLGRPAAGQPALAEADLKKFIAEEVTPRFTGGLTVLDGGPQWPARPENQLIREAAKVVLIVVPKEGDARAKIEAVRVAYKARFIRDSGLLVTQAACVAA